MSLKERIGRLLLLLLLIAAVTNIPVSASAANEGFLLASSKDVPPPQVKETATFEEFAQAVSALVQERNVPGTILLESSDEFSSGRLIVQCKTDTVSFEQYQPAKVIKSSDNLFILQFSSGYAAKKACRELNALAEVDYAEPDIRFSLDAQTKSQKTLSWGVSAIGADTYAKSVAKITKKTLKVAVIDSGISNHKFLSGRISPDGIDLIDGDYKPTDYEGHGTHVSGTIVDCTPGLNVKIMAVKVVDSRGNAYSINIANGILYAVKNGAKVINMSLGGEGCSELLHRSIAYAVQKGVTVVVSSGNEHDNTKTYCPAHLKDVIVVGAVDSDYERPYFSNYGSSVDIVAPGVDIKSCVPGGYETWEGTSMAAPHVSAAAAMIKLAHPSYTPAKIEKWIKNHAVDLGKKGRDNYYGYGLVNLKDQAAVPVSKVTLNKAKVTLTAGKSYQLTAKVTPSTATDKTLTWSSSNTKVAAVKNGKVTAKAAGKAKITVKSANGKKASCTVTVKAKKVAATSVKVSKSSISLNKGASLTLTATVLPKNATDKTVTWKSANVRIASVKDGKVTGVSAGQTTVTVTTANGKKDSCKVTVKNPAVEVTGVALSKSSLSLETGKNFQLTAAVYPGNATDKTITWISSDEAVASVKEGTVTGLSAGKTTITAKAGNGKKATCRVTVKDPAVEVTGVALSKSSLSLETGEKFQLTAAVSPANATDKTITWISSDEDVAAVSRDGTVTAYSAGKAVITAKSSNGKAATCEVTVKDPVILPDRVSLNRSSLTLNTGESYQFSATVYPSSAADKTVTWKSGDERIVSVKDGFVKALSAGETAITVRTVNGKEDSCKVTVKESTVEPDWITLNRYSLSLQTGESFHLTATVYPESATDKTVTWKSSSERIASVKDGMVTALSAGKATITVRTVNGKERSCEVTVKERAVDATGITLNKSSLSLKIGETFQLTAAVQPENATDKKVSWDTSNVLVAWVKDGLVTARAAGETTITASTRSGAKASCLVKVVDPTVEVTEVTISKSALTLLTGESYKLTASVKPDTATDKKITWICDDTLVAVVDQDGTVKGRYAGETTVRARAHNGKEASCQVTVKEPEVEVTKVTLNRSTLALDLGESFKLSAQVSPYNATVKTITFQSSDANVASVEAGGLVKGISAGKATITARAHNGVSASCEVTVTDKSAGGIEATDIQFSRKRVGLIPFASRGLGLSVTPSNAAVSFESSDNSVVKVNSSGTITGVGVGKARITARTVNGLTATCECIVLELSTDRTEYSFVKGEPLEIHARITLDHTLKRNGREYILYLAYSQGGWEELASFNIDGADFMEPRYPRSARITSCSVAGNTAEVTLQVDTSHLPSTTELLSLSVFPYDEFTTGGSLWDHLLTVNLR